MKRKKAPKTVLSICLYAILCGLFLMPAPKELAAYTGTKKVINLTHDGVARKYILYIPTTYTGTTNVPLILEFHPFNSWADITFSVSKLVAIADAQGFLAAWPDGYYNSWNSGDCCGKAKLNNIHDVGFAKAVVYDIKRTYKVDCARVYATGYSNGGEEAMRLAIEAPETFAAVSSYVGTPGMAVNPYRPVSVIMFRGINDTTCPYNGGWVDDGNGTQIYRESAASALDQWKTANSCTGSPVESYRNGLNYCQTYNSCAGGVKVTLCHINSDHFNMMDNPDGVPVAQMGWDFVKLYTEPMGGTCGLASDNGGPGTIGCGRSFNSAAMDDILFLTSPLLLGIACFGLLGILRYRRNRDRQDPESRECR